MPYYRGPQIPAAHCPEGTSMDETNATIDAHGSANVATCLTNMETSHDILCCRPVTFGIFESGIAPCDTQALYNSDCPALAYCAMRSLGQFTDSILATSFQQSRNATYRFRPYWHATHMSQIVRFSGNLGIHVHTS